MQVSKDETVNVAAAPPAVGRRAENAIATQGSRGVIAVHSPVGRGLAVGAAAHHIRSGRGDGPEFLSELELERSS